MSLPRELLQKSEWIGKAASVTVNTGVADRKGEYFHRQISIANNNGPVWQNVSITSGSPTNGTSGGLVFPAKSQPLVYDADGNLTSDGIWTYQWDAENRLTNMTMESIYGIANSNVLQLTFAYDYMNRRISKTVASWNGTTYVPQSTSYFVYDGWNLIAVFTPSGVIQQSFVWGLDLSGSMDQAGGIGGLLAMANAGTNYFVTYDGNGNITGLINGADKSTGARYEYSPFGEVLRATGPMAMLDPCGWSSKVTDRETGLVYYGYRYYNPARGRWIGRDSSGEQSALCLYLFCHNAGPNRFDSDGREDTISLGAAMTICGVVGGGIFGGCYSVFDQLEENGTVNWSSAGIDATLGAAGRLIVATGASLALTGTLTGGLVGGGMVSAEAFKDALTATVWASSGSGTLFGLVKGGAMSVLDNKSFQNQALQAVGGTLTAGDVGLALYLFQ